MKYTLIDLFAGAGGMTLGFVNTKRFQPVFAVELETAAAKTYSSNFGAHVFNGRIEVLPDSEFGSADVVIGGPPCQGFSPLGKTGDPQERRKMNQLWREYLRCVKAAKPSIFVVENVPEFLSSAQFADFLKTCASDPLLRRYRIVHSVLAAHDFGVPQVRRRAIIIGSRVGPVAFPEPSHGPARALPFATVRDAIGDLPKKPTDHDMHWRRNPTSVSLERYRAVPEGGNRFDLARRRPDLLPACWRNKPSGTTDVFGRMRWDAPASTIRTEFFKPEKGRYLHPTAHRPITHREAARLQTFPDSFVFEGSKTEVARQIGNAVPPMLAEAVARSVLATLRSKDR